MLLRMTDFPVEEVLRVDEQEWIVRNMHNRCVVCCHLDIFHYQLYNIEDSENGSTSFSHSICIHCDSICLVREE
jgi:hypothetical protein